MILPIKKKWFDMIKSGEKREEYREIKPYYTTRFLNACFLKKTVNPVTKTEWIEPYKSGIIGFRNGYSATSPTIFVKCHIHNGNEAQKIRKWKRGAYFIKADRLDGKTMVRKELLEAEIV